MPAVLPSQLTSGTTSMPAVLSSQLSNQAFRTANLAIGQNQSTILAKTIDYTVINLPPFLLNDPPPPLAPKTMLSHCEMH